MKNIFKQHQVPWIGGVKDILDHTLLFVSAINFLLITITAHGTVLTHHYPWLELWMFFLILLSAILLGMLMVYKFLLPSYYGFRRRQYGMDNLIKRIEDLERKDV